MNRILVIIACGLFLFSFIVRSVFPAPEYSISIHSVGDIVPGTNFRRNALPPGNGDILFKKILPYLKGADLLFGNFESAMTTYQHSRKNTNRRMVFAFRTPPKYASTLKRAGFDVLSIANNHSFDFYKKGFTDTAKYLRKAGIVPVGGKGDIQYISRKGIKIAFIAFGYTSQFNSVNSMAHAASLVKRAVQKADIIVVSMHAGAEGSKAIHTRNKSEIFYGENRGNLVKFSHLMIQKGADLILGHGPHVPRALEIYRGRLIAYSLGNFVGYKVFSLKGPKGLSYILRTELKSNGEFYSGKLIPAYLNSNGIPLYDHKKRSIRLIQKLSRSDFPKSKLIIHDDGYITRQ